MPHITLNNTDFYYELSGQGQPLVLVSGYASDHAAGWQPLVDALQNDFQILRFDNRGMGQTREHDLLPLTAERMADDTFALIEALGLKKPHVVGHSMGGNIVQVLAAKHPEAIRSIALITSSSKWREAMLRGIQSMLDMAQKGSFDQYFNLNLAWVFGEEFLHDPEKIAQRRAQFVNNPHPPTPANLQRQFAVLKQFDGRAYLPHIKAPALVLYGREDLISLPYESQAMAEALPNAKLIELPCGHGLPLEQPKLLAQHLRKAWVITDTASSPSQCNLARCPSSPRLTTF